MRRWQGRTLPVHVEQGEASAYSLLFLFVTSFIHHKVLFSICLFGLGELFYCTFKPLKECSFPAERRRGTGGGRSAAHQPAGADALGWGKDLLHILPLRLPVLTPQSTISTCVPEVQPPPTPACTAVPTKWPAAHLAGTACRLG